MNRLKNGNRNENDRSHIQSVSFGFFIIKIARGIVVFAPIIFINPVVFIILFTFVSFTFIFELIIWLIFAIFFFLIKSIYILTYFRKLKYSWIKD